jgi:hypothetical protein
MIKRCDSGSNLILNHSSLMDKTEKKIQREIRVYERLSLFHWEQRVWFYIVLHMI